MANRSVNKVTLLGHLGKDAETKFTPSGVAVTNFSVATTRSWKPADSSEWKEETNWTNIILWRSENLAAYLKKGTGVYLEGRLQARKYEKDGVTKYVTEVVAEQVILLPRGGGNKEGDNGELASKPRGAAAAAVDPATFDQGITDDDVPF